MSDRILTADGARLWLAMDGWAHDEAAWLLLGFDPHRLTAQSVRVGGRMVLLPPPEPDPQDPFVAMLSRAGEAAALRFPAPPADVIEWAMKKGLRLPAPLIPAGAFVRDGRWMTAAEDEPQVGETPTRRRTRRLVRLRELGGDMRRAGESWHCIGRRGALADLVREEAAAGRPMAFPANVRDDLKAAMGDIRNS